jgi:hypothetical protein
MSAREVSVQIDELVLVGFDDRDREAVATALRDELAQLLRRVQSRLDGAAHAELEYQLAGDRRPAEIGRAAARSIAAHLGEARG